MTFDYNTFISFYTYHINIHGHHTMQHTRCSVIPSMHTIGYTYNIRLSWCIFQILTYTIIHHWSKCTFYGSNYTSRRPCTCMYDTCNYIQWRPSKTSLVLTDTTHYVTASTTRYLITCKFIQYSYIYTTRRSSNKYILTCVIVPKAWES